MSGFVPTLEQIVARMKGEILCDIAAGRVARRRPLLQRAA